MVIPRHLIHMVAEWLYAGNCIITLIPPLDQSQKKVAIYNVFRVKGFCKNPADRVVENQLFMYT